MGDNTRRKILKYSGTSAALALAGCMGGQGDNSDSGSDGGDGGDGNDGSDGSDDDASGGGAETVIYGGAPSSSSSFARGQALQSVLDERSDIVEMSTQETGGNEANIRLYDNEEIDAYPANLNVVFQGMYEEGPFGERAVDTIPPSIYNNDPDAQMLLTLADSDIETTADIVEQDASVWPIDAGSSNRVLALDVFEAAGWPVDDMDILNVPMGDIAGAIDEGRVDAFIAYGWNTTSPGWLTEVDSRFDLQYVEPTDNFIQSAWDFRDTLPVRDFSADEADLDQDIGTDTIQSWAIVGYEFWGEEVSNEAVYEVLRVALEYNDEVNEASNSFPVFEDAHDMIENLGQEGIPVHPGAAEFYRDQGVWEEYDLEEGTNSL